MNRPDIGRISNEKAAKTIIITQIINVHDPQGFLARAGNALE